jgi:hypothetical protein
VTSLIKFNYQLINGKAGIFSLMFFKKLEEMGEIYQNDFQSKTEDIG